MFQLESYIELCTSLPSGFLKLYITCGLRHVHKAVPSSGVITHGVCVHYCMFRRAGARLISIESMPADARVVSTSVWNWCD